MNKITVTTLLEKKKKHEPITVLTAYDYTFSRILDEAEIDVILIGDSLGMVVLGHPTTLPVTLEDMIRHTQAVSRGTKRALLVADMPFMSYQINEDETLRNAGRLVGEGAAEAVKLEGGRPMAKTIRRLVSTGIPVMGHLGLTPQSVNVFGGYKVQGKSSEDANRLFEDAKALEDAGCFSIVLECIPAEVAEKITKTLKIPTIGIGAGPKCDGQVLVLYDCLGLTADLHPKFVKRFADLREQTSKAVKQYIQEVKSGTFPSKEQSF